MDVADRQGRRPCAPVRLRRPVVAPAGRRPIPLQGRAELRENRALARAPRLGADRLASVPALFDRYYSDHFGLRRELIWAHDLLRVRMLGVYSSKQVVVGKDDWLFLVSDKAIEDHQGLERFSEEQLRAWQEVLEGKQAWLAEQGLPTSSSWRRTRRASIRSGFPATCSGRVR